MTSKYVFLIIIFLYFYSFLLLHALCDGLPAEFKSELSFICLTQEIYLAFFLKKKKDGKNWTHNHLRQGLCARLSVLDQSYNNTSDDVEPANF